MTYIDSFYKMRENGEFINGIDFNNENHYKIFYNLLNEIGVEESFLNNPAFIKDLKLFFINLTENKQCELIIGPTTIKKTERNVIASTDYATELRIINGHPTIISNAKIPSKIIDETISYKIDENSNLIKNTEKQIFKNEKQERINTNNKYDKNGICFQKELNYDSNLINKKDSNIKINSFITRNPELPIIESKSTTIINNSEIKEEYKSHLDIGNVNDLDILRDFHSVSTPEEVEQKLNQNKVVIAEIINNNLLVNENLKDYYIERYSNFPELIELLSVDLIKK